MSLIPQEPSPFRPENRPLTPPSSFRQAVGSLPATPPAEPAPPSRLLDLNRQPGVPLDQWQDQEAAERERVRRGEQPPRQEGETPKVDDDMYVALADEVYLNACAAPSVREELASKAHDAILKLLEERNAAERRAADAEAELAKWRIISDGDTPEGASERLGEIKSKVESVIAMVEQTDTLPGTARFEDKPHPDSLRLDWLEKNSVDVFANSETTDSAIMLGVRGGKLRELVDAAMSAPSAKGATP